MKFNGQKTMRKYYFLTYLLSIFALSTSAQAASANDSESSTNVHTHTTNESLTQTKGGFYVGGGVNYSWSDYDLNAEQSTSLTTNGGVHILPTESYSNSQSAFSDGVGGQLFAGYDYFINPLFSIALEAQVGTGNNEGELNNSATVISGSGVELISEENTAKLKQKWSFGLSLLPTYHSVYNIDLFGVLGWQISRFNISGKPGSITNLNQQVLSAYESLSMASVNSSHTVNGIQLGFGMKKKFTESLGMRLEYNWTRFGSFNASGSNSVNYNIDPISSEINYNNSIDVSVKPTVQQVKLSLVYDID